MRRTLFTEDHEAFRELARDFIEKEVVPAYPQWEKAGRMPREAFAKLGETGILGMAIPEEYGGHGLGITEATLLLEEVARSGAAMNGASAIHLNIFGMQPVVKHGSDAIGARD